LRLGLSAAATEAEAEEESAEIDEPGRLLCDETAPRPEVAERTAWRSPEVMVERSDAGMTITRLLVVDAIVAFQPN